MKYIVPVLFISFIYNSCVSFKDLRGYAVKAKENKYNCFIAYENGDTLIGAKLVRKRSLITSKTEVLLDGKSIPQVTKNKVVTYQDERGFHYPDYIIDTKNGMYTTFFEIATTRIIKGRISMYASKKNVDASGKTQTTFYLSRGGHEISQKASSAVLEQLVKDYPPALQQLHKEFPKISGATSNEYRKMIAVLDIYNNR